MKTILITQRVDVDRITGQRNDSLDQRWINYLIQLNCNVLVAPNNIAMLGKMLDFSTIDGIVLSGGNDLDIFGGSVPERDLVERSLIEYGVKNSIPIFGVCRGMQIIQQYFNVQIYRVEGHIGPHEIDGVYGRRVVNSFHNYGTRESVPDLQVMARSSDGVVEAVMHLDHLIMGIMWHPERECNKESEFSKNLFMNFMRLTA